MKDADYLKAVGAKILSEANDLKRTPEALATELGRDSAVVHAIIEGKASVSEAQSLLHAIAAYYPVSLSDLWVDPDDTDAGVRVMSRDQSEDTSRVFERVDRSGELSPYYTYRDTAMSRGSPFKPEWIQPLRCVDDADPDNPDVTYNKGHLMHQMTFFIGEVNFYWQIGDEKHCAEMNTGDSNYITPFVPHSFTSRRSDALGLIVAVTYAGQVRSALNDFAAVGSEAAEAMSGDLRDFSSAFRALINRQMAAEALCESDLVGRLESAGMSTASAQAILNATSMPAYDDIRHLAMALNVRPEDLMVTPLDREQEVVLRFAKDSPSRLSAGGNDPAYRLTDLARTPHQPDLKGFELTVLDGSVKDNAEIVHGLHEYVYNYGDAPVTMHWDANREARLEPGDSAYVRPMIKHRFERESGGEEGHLAIVRVPGNLTGAAIGEFAAFTPGVRARAAQETTKWF